MNEMIVKSISLIKPMLDECISGRYYCVNGQYWKEMVNRVNGFMSFCILYSVFWGPITKPAEHN
jgi:hypothetical protein